MGKIKYNNKYRIEQKEGIKFNKLKKIKIRMKCNNHLLNNSNNKIISFKMGKIGFNLNKLR